jgi:hypothetical protein
MEDQMTKYIRLDEVAPDRWDRDLDAAKDWARGRARDSHYYKPYDMQAKPSHTSRPETGQYVTVRQILFTIAQTCQRLQIPTRVVRYEGEHTVLVSCDLIPGSYSGTTNVGQLQGALTKALRGLHPQIVLDLIEIQNGLGGADHIGNGFTRAVFRARTEPNAN